MSKSGQQRTTQRLEQVASITALALVVVGCFVVLRPFLSALLWAGILCFSSWPFYRRIERFTGGRRNLAAACMVTLVALVLVVPFALTGVTLAGNLSRIIAVIGEVARSGLPQAPAWLERIPIVGADVVQRWEELTRDPDRLVALVKEFLARSQNWLLKRGADLGQGVFQMSLSVLISFFIYRDGENLFRQISDGINRLAGDRTQHLLGLVGRTVRGVVYGVLGTALAQGTVAVLGFWIAGVPAPLLLGLLVFVLSIVPVGPPLVWIPAAVWLYHRHGLDWAVFMAVYGFVVISGIDNLVRPLLISRETQQPFVLMLLGVLGGVIAFGFIGFFVGPTLLAVGYNLAGAWSQRPPPADPVPAAVSPPASASPGPPPASSPPAVADPPAAAAS